ncbi:MAG: hypothetical protein FJW37_10850 [Acidobacteria bacterium]|nr:hypothetical protein [Acidobacteriota bacterium]
MTSLLAGFLALTLSPDPLANAFERLYNFDFAGAHAILDRHIAAHPADPLLYAVRSAVYLFHELDRLKILESEFFADNSRIVEKRKLRADPEIKARLFEALNESQSRAGAMLGSQTREPGLPYTGAGASALKAAPDQRRALFAMCIALGVATDYSALVENRQLRSLATARSSHRYAQALLRSDPQFYDAYATTGLSEYLIGSLPFFIRWFARFDNVQGSKELAVEKLEIAARQGRYFRGFAKILLSIIHLRENRPPAARQILGELAREYPENPLIRKELAKLSAGGR